MKPSEGTDRDAAELAPLWDDDLSHLEELCEAFDKGNPNRGRQISAVLRRLLGDGDSALLQQVGLQDHPFEDTAGHVGRGMPYGLCSLLHTGIGKEAVYYVPRGAADPPPVKRHFREWWPMPVFSEPRGLTLSRSQMVTHVANKDGGVHVDRKIPEGYWRISRMNSLDHKAVMSAEGALLGIALPSPGQGRPGVIVFMNPGTPPPPDTYRYLDCRGRPEMMAMRQIAYEVLLTFRPERVKAPPVPGPWVDQ